MTIGPEGEGLSVVNLTKKRALRVEKNDVIERSDRCLQIAVTRIDKSLILSNLILST